MRHFSITARFLTAGLAFLLMAQPLFAYGRLASTSALGGIPATQALAPLASFWRHPFNQAPFTMVCETFVTPEGLTISALIFRKPHGGGRSNPTAPRAPVNGHVKNGSHSQKKPPQKLPIPTALTPEIPLVNEEFSPIKRFRRFTRRWIFIALGGGIAYILGKNFIAMHEQEVVPPFRSNEDVRAYINNQLDDLNHMSRSRFSTQEAEVLKALRNNLEVADLGETGPVATIKNSVNSDGSYALDRRGRPTAILQINSTYIRQLEGIDRDTADSLVQANLQKEQQTLLFSWNHPDHARVLISGYRSLMLPIFKLGYEEVPRYDQYDERIVKLLGDPEYAFTLKTVFYMFWQPEAAGYLQWAKSMTANNLGDKPLDLLAQKYAKLKSSLSDTLSMDALYLKRMKVDSRDAERQAALVHFSSLLFGADTSLEYRQNNILQLALYLEIKEGRIPMQNGKPVLPTLKYGEKKLLGPQLFPYLANIPQFLARTLNEKPRLNPVTAIILRAFFHVKVEPLKYSRKAQEAA